MNTRHNRRAIWFRAAGVSALAASTFATGAAAQQASGATPAPTAVQEVVVTAEKRTERLQDLPMAASVVTGSQLISTQATTLQDVANTVPGLQLIANSPTANELVIRGISVAAGVNSSVATYVDEVPYTTEGPFAGSASIAPNFDTYDLARVEVLRGPQGTLYGANALGGLLKYVTNAPDPSRYSASFLTGVSSVDHSDQTGWEAHGMVNLPLGDNAALRIVGDDSYFPGYIDDPSRGAKDINYVRRDGVRASLLWEPTQSFSLRLSANYQNLYAGDNSNEDISAATLKPIYGDLIQERVIAQPTSESNQIYNGTINWNLGFATLVSSTSYTEVNPVDTVDLSSAYGPTLDSMFGGNYGAALGVTEPVQSVTQEIRLASPKDQTFEWTAGVYYTDESAVEDEPLYPVDANTGQILYNFTPGLGTYHITSTYQEYAAFGDLTYHVTPAFDLSAGGRFSSNNQTYHQVNAGLFSGADDFTTNSRQSVFTYSVDAKYRFSPRLMVYGRIATGFVPGGPNDVLPNATLPATFRSSTTTNYEIGVKGAADGGRVAYDLDAFDVEWQDIQLFAEVNNLYAMTNGGAARSDGLEGSLSYVPVTGLTLSLNGAYTNARLTQDTPASFGGLAGDRLPLSPFFAGTAAANYERHLWNDVSGFAGVEWHYDGGRMSEYEFGAPRQELPAYSLVDLHAGLKYGAYTLTAYVKNVADARAINNVSTETIGTVAALSAAVETPRTIGMTLGASF